MKRVNIEYKDHNGYPKSKVVELNVSDNEWFINPGYYSNTAARNNLFMCYLPDAKEIITWVPS